MQHSTEKLRWRYYNHEKIANRTIVLEKGHVDVYTENDITLYAYQTRKTCENAAEMKEKVEKAYPNYSGMSYLDMTVGFFFPAK